ncbi:MAG: YkgJ family cysteine cluster protein [Granulosicoccaceae bacterium]|jgi:Fe-S-cluster containining protein
MDYRDAQLRFECTRCGACCCGDEDHYIAVREQDLQAICDHLDISLAWLKRRYIEHLTRHYYTVRIGDDGRCVFLNRQGDCRIYPVRPVQCQTYPYWPEILADNKHWHAEANRCEGINRGNIVPLELITRALRRQQQFEKDEPCDT